MRSGREGVSLPRLSQSWFAEPSLFDVWLLEPFIVNPGNLHCKPWLGRENPGRSQREDRLRPCCNHQFLMVKGMVARDGRQNLLREERERRRLFLIVRPRFATIPLTPIKNDGRRMVAVMVTRATLFQPFIVNPGSAFYS